MTDQHANDRLGKAVLAFGMAWGALQETMSGKGEREFGEAFAAFEEAEDEYERAQVAADLWPSFPPRTDEGRQRYGMTRDQVNALIARGRADRKG